MRNVPTRTNVQSLGQVCTAYARNARRSDSAKPPVASMLRSATVAAACCSTRENRRRCLSHGRVVSSRCSPGSNIELFVDDCLRKQRRGAADDTLYVWTNLELEWEEHRWLEARLVPEAGDHGGAQLLVTVNGEPWLRAQLPSVGEPRVTQFELP